MGISSRYQTKSGRNIRIAERPSRRSVACCARSFGMGSPATGTAGNRPAFGAGKRKNGRRRSGMCRPTTEKWPGCTGNALWPVSFHACCFCSFLCRAGSARALTVRWGGTLCGVHTKRFWENTPNDRRRADLLPAELPGKRKNGRKVKRLGR